MNRNLLGQYFRQLTLALMGAAVFAGMQQPVAAQTDPNAPNRIQFTVDIAEDMALFVEPRVPAGTMPARGSFFVTEGKIFPEGTIPNSNGEQFDPNAVSGEIGRWFCKGTFLVGGAEFDKAAEAVLTDQLFIFPTGERTIATTGTEGNGSSLRAIVGGTGIYAGYTGEQRQQFLGFNKTGGVNVRVTFILTKIANHR